MLGESLIYGCVVAHREQVVLTHSDPARRSSDLRRRSSSTATAMATAATRTDRASGFPCRQDGPHRGPFAFWHQVAVPEAPVTSGPERGTATAVQISHRRGGNGMQAIAQDLKGQGASHAGAPQGARLAPVAAGERIVALDVVRGFALFGIFLMNVEFFNRPIADLDAGLPLAGGSGLD